MGRKRKHDGFCVGSLDETASLGQRDGGGLLMKAVNILKSILKTKQYRRIVATLGNMHKQKGENKSYPQSGLPWWHSG